MDELTRDYKALVRNAWRVFSLSHRSWSKSLETFGLSTSTFPILEAILQQPGIGQQEISDELSIDKSCTSRGCRFLEENGFIYRKKSSDHAHGFQCFPCVKGIQAFEQVLAAEHQQIHKIFSSEEHDEVKKTLEMLVRLVEKLKDK